MMVKQVRGRDKFNKFKPLINTICRLYSIFPKKIRIILLEHYRKTKGTKGLILRYALLKSIALKCGDNVSIHPEVYLLSPDKLIIGDNVSIHPMCYIDATGGIEIGNDVSIAHSVTIMSTTHFYNDIKKPIKDQSLDYRYTKISGNVWIAAKATVLAGIEVGHGCIVAANSVVTKNIQENTVVGGVPAVILKKR